MSGCLPLTVGATFTIDACWTVDADHDTFLRVPNAAGSMDENPFIKYDCNPGGGCATEYPFACVNEDVANDPGCEVTTVYQRLGGQYQYWSELDPASPAGEVTVTLRDSGGVCLPPGAAPRPRAASARSAGMSSTSTVAPGSLPRSTRQSARICPTCSGQRSPSLSVTDQPVEKGLRWGWLRNRPSLSRQAPFPTLWAVYDMTSGRA